MLFFRKKDKEAPSNEKKAARSMPKTKKVQFMPVKTAELTELLNKDLYELTKLEPVNYYATKNSYLQVFLRGRPERGLFRVRAV